MIPYTPADPSAACDSIRACRTLDNIISASLVTILACIWTAVHRNVPGPAVAGRSRLRHSVARVLELVQIVAVTLLVPEWVFAWAVRQLLIARDVAKQLESVRNEAKRAWEVKRGGDEGGGDGRRECTDSGNGNAREYTPSTNLCAGRLDGSSLAVDERVGRLGGNWTTQHGFFVIMGGFHLYEDGEPRHPLSRWDVVELVRTGDLVPPTNDEIRGLSQGDALSKALAVVQTLWFVGQSIARHAEDLPITQLEVMALAYTTVTIAMYVAWWSKPQNVGSPVRVAVKLPEPWWAEEVNWYQRILAVTTGWQDLLVDLRKQSRVPTFYSGNINNHDSGLYADVVALCAAMVFGAVHCAAWNYDFPSRAEQHLWRISSIGIIALPGAMLLVILALWVLEKYEDVLPYIAMSVFFLSSPMYIAARVLLLVLSFTTLRSLPPEAYRAVQWTLLIPHLA
ncbi:hypothetical protein BV25DRAFT_1828651 [Artomyces pyxidatus]|uniref:Uncharacterized protein n=1 Tax=Artomyces pyxidatus TaxID=48021 RepID=A0ACB8SSU3_9AGAM|nr:hypothetical protein BV25DRAFT_1828651 [Artomyces pyxidatus]